MRFFFFFPLNELPLDVFKFISKLISLVNQDTLQFSFPCSEHCKIPGLLFRIDSHESTDPGFSTNSSRSKVWRGEFCGCVWHNPFHHQLLEGETSMELQKPQEYQLCDQECQKRFIRFFLCSVEKNSPRWSKFLQLWDWIKPNHLEFVQCALPISVSISGTEIEISRKEKLLKMYQNNQIFPLPNCQTLLLPSWMGVLDLGCQPLQDLPEVLLFPGNIKVWLLSAATACFPPSSLPPSCSSHGNKHRRV